MNYVGTLVRWTFFSGLYIYFLSSVTLLLSLQFIRRKNLGIILLLYDLSLSPSASEKCFSVSFNSSCLFLEFSFILFSGQVNFPLGQFILNQFFYVSVNVGWFLILRPVSRSILTTENFSRVFIGLCLAPLSFLQTFFHWPFFLLFSIDSILFFCKAHLRFI